MRYDTMCSNEKFFEQYAAWQEDATREFERRFNIDVAETPVEFSDAGDAYVHGIGGIAHIPNAVTPWRKSKHFVE